jgi:hypothetical protein
MASQVTAEWADIENLAAAAAILNGVELHHLAYPSGCGQARWEKVVDLSGQLGSGKAVRVHSGIEVPVSQLRPEDVRGAGFYLFAGRGLHVWSHAEGDCAGLWKRDARQWMDKISYDLYPPDGVVLVRQGDKLILIAGRGGWR